MARHGAARQGFQGHGRARPGGAWQGDSAAGNGRRFAVNGKVKIVAFILEIICYCEIAGLLALWALDRMPWGLVLVLGALCGGAAIRAAEERHG